ncbi:nicotinate-nucleotide adenylyltransferase [Coxiella endosymbiont of Ornithodoros maritimus]|uniref:nicotinate-nucleotide adenylyltransferase n=1 Tax=Coxiella endosymbiont of Ornithodoros maritimus TaxID=1656172 RepID=UPI0022652CB0|nr:nicotinate-nucleotide adenylyltransferase [Coxiella endosymbiont of Ornithodoros maritimus]
MKRGSFKMFPLLGLFGGTFDPIHNGHLALANELIQKLPSLTEIQFIPSRQPPHRPPPIASPADRLEMIKRAIANQPNLVLNNVEIKGNDISYTINTLKTLRPLFPTQALCFILSTDAFADFKHWHQSSVILEYCHLIVVNRPNYPLPQQPWLSDLLCHHQTENTEDLGRFQFGKIFFQTLSPQAISATQIRCYLPKSDYEIVAPLLPKTALAYIKAHKLYQE